MLSQCLRLRSLEAVRVVDTELAIAPPSGSRTRARCQVARRRPAAATSASNVSPKGECGRPPAAERHQEARHSVSETVVFVGTTNRTLTTSSLFTKRETPPGEVVSIPSRGDTGLGCSWAPSAPDLRREHRALRGALRDRDRPLLQTTRDRLGPAASACPSLHRSRGRWIIEPGRVAIERSGMAVQAGANGGGRGREAADSAGLRCGTAR